MKIMLTEVTNQSPMDPQETGKLVENMRQLQELANSTYTKFRDDIRWAQDLEGKSIQVQQRPIDAKQKEALENKGLKPDTGYGAVIGKADGFRVVEQTVYISVGGKDYPVDNIKQIIPQAKDPTQLANMADRLLGRTVVYDTGPTSDGSTPATAAGVVTAVTYDDDANIQLEVGDTKVPFSRVVQIGASGG